MLKRLYRTRGLFRRRADRRDDDLFNRDTLQVGELLAERVSLGRDAADDAMRRTQLLHHHVQVAIQGTEGGILIRAGHGVLGGLLLAARAFQRASAAVRFLARQTDDERFGGGSGFRS